MVASKVSQFKNKSGKKTIVITFADVGLENPTIKERAEATAKIRQLRKDAANGDDSAKEAIAGYVDRSLNRQKGRAENEKTESFFIGKEQTERKVEYSPKTKEISFKDPYGYPTKAFPVTQKQLKDIKAEKKSPEDVFYEYQVEKLKTGINQNRDWLSKKPAFVPKAKFENEMIALNRIARSKGDTVVFEQGRNTYKYKVTRVTPAKVAMQDVETGKKTSFPTSYVSDGLIRKMGGDLSREGSNYFSFVEPQS